MDPLAERQLALTRRGFLGRAGGGLGSIAVRVPAGRRQSAAPKPRRMPPAPMAR